MDTTPSPLLRSPEREAIFGVLAILWAGVSVARSLSIELTLVVAALLAAGYFTLRLIQAVERLAAATEQLAHESDELSDSVKRWPWQWL